MKWNHRTLLNLSKRKKLKAKLKKKPVLCTMINPVINLFSLLDVCFCLLFFGTEWCKSKYFHPVASIQLCTFFSFLVMLNAWILWQPLHRAHWRSPSEKAMTCWPQQITHTCGSLARRWVGPGTENRAIGMPVVSLLILENSCLATCWAMQPVVGAVFS